MSDPAACVLIIDTHVRHDLADGAYARRRAECEEATRQLGMTALAAAGPSLVARSGRLDPVLQRRARHVISENERTLAAARAIRSGDWPKLGALMYDSHRSLSDDFEVSCRELDIVVDTARFLGEDAGVFGCRMTGGGFGGCAICLVRTDMVGRVRQAIADSYRELTGKAATILSSRPSDGARRINTPQRRPAR
jgi:galactokinase